MRHHNPARWPSDDGFGGATPHKLVEPGVAIGAHYQEIDGVCIDVSLKHLSDRAAVNLHRRKARLYAVLCKMAYKRCPGFQYPRHFFIACSDDADVCSRRKYR